MGKISYKNVYGTEEYKKYIQQFEYVLDRKYFRETELYTLPNDYTLEVKIYDDTEQKDKQYYVTKAYAEKCTLKKSGQDIYEYICFNYGHTRCFTEFIHHKNGHRYLPFHTDLYGISYLDIDTLEVFNYIPEGYPTSYPVPMGESFIITDIHYDINSNLIAYGGCYWGGCSEVMIGDFSDPLNFNPHLANTHEIFDPDYDNYSDIDFKEWRDGKLYVMCDGNSSEENSISIQKLRNMLN